MELLLARSLLRQVHGDPGSEALYFAEFENNFAVSLRLGRMFYRFMYLRERITLFHIGAQQPALGHVENSIKRFHALGLAGDVVPFVNPNAAEPEILKNEQAVWNFQ